MNNLIGLGISLGFVILIIALSTLLEKAGLLKSEGSRKFIHIGVSNWWFIAMFCFDSWYTAIIVPALFIIVNALSFKKQLIGSMERGGGLEDLGTVYYAISLTILAAWTFAVNQTWIGAIGILIMGYGDGFAAVVGKRFGKHPLPFGLRKSWEGSLTVLVLAFAITCTTLVIVGSTNPGAIIGISLAVAVAAMVLEAVTPLGFDNLSVPLGTAVLVAVLANVIG